MALMGLMLFCAGLSGCSGGADFPAPVDSGPDATPDPAAQHPKGNQTPAPTDALRFSDSMFWSTCMSSGGAFNWPGDADHARHPPGWDPRPGATTTFQMFGWVCERVHWGHFERGPIQMFLEFHNFAYPPESCHPDPAEVEGVVGMRMLNSFWIDDAELAAYARDVYKMPVYHTTFEVSNGFSPLGPTIVWEWPSPTGERNEFEVLSQADFVAKDTFDYRLYWSNATGVSFMDAGFTKQTFSLTAPRYGHGVLHEPFLMAEWPTDYYGPGEWYGEGHADMEFQRFLDFECKQPIV